MLEGHEVTPLHGTVGDLLEVKGRALHVVSPDTSVHDAVAEMDRIGIGALLVTDREALVGILSERDCTRRLILQSRSPRETRVAEIMSTGVITVEPSTSLSDCLVLVTNRHIRHLPVVERGRVIALVSIGDLVREVLTHQAETIASLHSMLGSDYPK
jgi:CBS domain-containing protein